MTTITTPLPQFFDRNGVPLTGGSVYIGQPYQDPESAPAEVFWDEDFTQPAAQPIKTLNGFPVRAGTPATLHTRGDHSMLTRDSRGRQVFYARKAIGIEPVGNPVDPHAFPWLVKGDGVTDDYPALQAAITFAGTSGRRVVELRGGKTYRCATGTLTLGQNGLQLIGPSSQSCNILVDQTTGPGVHVAKSYCRVQGMQILASTTRANYTTGGTYELANTLIGLQCYEPAGYLQTLHIEDVVSVNHPSHGFYLGGGGTDSKFVHCAAYGNRGHGFFFDDRTFLGGTSLRVGQITHDSCRAVDNGGQALHFDCVTGPCYRFLVINFETIWNAWNTFIPGYQPAELQIGGENHVIMICAQSPGPAAYSRTTTLQGRPRLAVPTPTSGMYIGSNSGSITLIENRFIMCRRGVKTAGNVPALELRVKGAYFTQQDVSGVSTNVLIGFDIGTNALELDIDVQANMPVDFMVIKAGGSVGTLRVGGVTSKIYGNSTGELFQLDGYRAATIVSSNINAQGRWITLNPSAPDTVVSMNMAGGANPLLPGEQITLFNVSPHAITFNHGTGASNVRTRSGANTVVPAGGRFVVVTDPSGNPWEV